MSRPQKILIDFNQFSDSDLVTRAQTVIDSLTGNPDITTPQPTIPQLQTGVDDFRIAITAAETGGKQQREIRDQKRLTLIELLQQEATYVSMIANKNVAIMLGAGFDVSKIPSPVGPLPKPTKFVVSSPQKGWLKLSLTRIKGAGSYQYEYKKVEDTQWTILTEKRAKIIVQGLESAKEYVARVLPIGASTDKTYSDEITAVVI
jgi:hypothetical protein